MSGSNSIDKLTDKQLRSVVLEYLAKSDCSVLQESINNAASTANTAISSPSSSLSSSAAGAAVVESTTLKSTIPPPPEKCSNKLPPHDAPLGRTVRVKSQQEVAEKFAQQLESHGTLYKKNATAFVRKAIKGEAITTTIFGAKETEMTVADDSLHVVCGQAAFETYTVNNFSENYDSEHPMEIEIDLPPYRRLRELGFKEYRSKRQVLAKRVDKEDMEWFQCGTDLTDDNDEAFFVAPWGEQMIVNEGDFLVMTYPRDNEIYRIESHVFATTYSK